MGKCKNTGCDNIVSDNRKYCSLKCRNVYVNKNLRDYSAIRTFSLNKEKYNKKPKKCHYCDNAIEYERRYNKFCSQSCSAISGNTGKKRTEKTKLKIQRSHLRIWAENGRLIIVNCRGCGKKIERRRHRKFCTNECRKKYRRRNLSEYSIYKFDTQFRFNLADYSREFDFKLVKKYGWYKPVNRGNNIGGVSRDHIFSVREGFRLGISAHIIRHPANCRLLVNSKNISKCAKCDISIEELIDKIRRWDKKYKHLCKKNKIGA